MDDRLVGVLEAWPLYVGQPLFRTEIIFKNKLDDSLGMEILEL